jgi:hypothetical protein
VFIAHVHPAQAGKMKSYPYQGIPIEFIIIQDVLHIVYSVSAVQGRVFVSPVKTGLEMIGEYWLCPRKQGVTHDRRRGKLITHINGCFNWKYSVLKVTFSFSFGESGNFTV